MEKLEVKIEGMPCSRTAFFGRSCSLKPLGFNTSATENPMDGFPTLSFTMHS